MTITTARRTQRLIVLLSIFCCPFLRGSGQSTTSAAGPFRVRAPDPTSDAVPARKLSRYSERTVAPTLPRATGRPQAYQEITQYLDSALTAGKARTIRSSWACRSWAFSTSRTWITREKVARRSFSSRCSSRRDENWFRSRSLSIYPSQQNRAAPIASLERGAATLVETPTLAGHLALDVGSGQTEEVRRAALPFMVLTHCTSHAPHN